MTYDIKVEKNILYLRNLEDLDPTYELLPISKIHFVSKLVKQIVSPPQHPTSTEHIMVIALLIGIPSGTITLPTIPFTDETYHQLEIQESINKLRGFRENIVNAVELYNGGIMINKPKPLDI